MANLVSRAEAAKLIGVSTKTIQRAELAGKLDPIRINKTRTVYRLADILNFQNKRK